MMRNTLVVIPSSEESSCHSSPCRRQGEESAPDLDADAEFELEPDDPTATITIRAVADTRKRCGEAAEAAFLARATALGFPVCLPWGDSNRYDSNRRTRPRIPPRPGQIRQSLRREPLARPTTGASGKVHTSEEIDLFVACIVPENIWYLIPVQVGRRKSLRFYSHTRHRFRAHLEEYRESWCLLDSIFKVRTRQGYPRPAAAANPSDPDAPSAPCGG